MQKRYIRFRGYLLVLCMLPFVLHAQEDLTVIQPHWVNFNDGKNALYKHFTSEAMDYLHQRERTVAALNSASDWTVRQAWIREKLHDVVGPFPEKTPLNARVTGTLEKGNFLAQHIVFESQPGYYVTSTLYLPKGLKGKAPAILFCSGHAAEGYRSPTYQHMILNLVYKGFIVFAFDPVGQGERLEYFDPQTNKPTVGGPTKQHSYPGAQAFVAGSSQAKYMIWDGIRAVDYLHTRSEVDTDRIGITGRSGGGTQSAYIAAFDDRIYAAAPENYITTFKRLLLTHGPQDAEQNFYRGIQQGLDQPDLLTVRAPRPALMVVTSRDIFNIEGAREAASEVARSYHALGSPENFEMVEDDAGHASTPKNREAMYAFFQRHLNLPGDSRDEAVDSLSAQELQVTATGQALTSYGGKRTVDLNSDMLIELGENIKGLEEIAKDLSGYRASTGSAETMMVGRFQRDGYSVEKHLMKGEGDYWIPYILMKPDRAVTKAVIYLDPLGKTVDAKGGGQMEDMVKAGVMVVAPDLLNVGEMGKGSFAGDSHFEGHSYNLWFGTLLIGRSIVGIQAGDVNRLVRVLQEKEGAQHIKTLAKGAMNTVALHAALFNPAIRDIALVDPLLSFQDLVRSPEYDPSLIQYAIPAVGNKYDITHLLGVLADRNLLVVASGPNSDTENFVPVESPLRSSFPLRMSEEEIRINVTKWAAE